ncbi:GMP reductase [symbiont of Argiope bruennichi]|uniref:GMP reductase n=1 Tax=symbiont of Argiope bruennichi TaxID=2810479 RepID=UPI003DA2D3B5
MKKKIKFDFEDINLVARKCIVKSRKECDTSVKLSDFKFDLPIIPANMSTIISKNLCIWLAQNNYFYIMHRFFDDQIEFCKEMKRLNLYISISIGVKKTDENFLIELIKSDLIPDFITIDIAHGHSKAMEKMLLFVKNTFASLKKKPFIIAGNVMTIEAIKDLSKWGANAIKFGIGPGKVCITKLKTGFGTGGWQLNALKDVSEVAKKLNIPLILDGGVRCNGDITKSLAFGATMVMCGNLLAGHDECADAKTVEINGKKYKEYYGSASIFNKNNNSNIEGKKILVLYKGSIKDTYREIKEDLQSSISYSGGKDLSSLKECDYVIIKGTITNSDYR